MRQTAGWLQMPVLTVVQAASWRRALVAAARQARRGPSSAWRSSLAGTLSQQPTLCTVSQHVPPSPRRCSSLQPLMLAPCRKSSSLLCMQARHEQASC